MKYSDYTPSPMTPQEKEEETARFVAREEYITKYVNDHHLVRLKSDYWGMDRFYYDKQTNRMYTLSSSNTSVTPTFELCNDTHIMELNEITY